jgi:hypothetical protein
VAEELVVGTIVAVDEHPGGRAPSLLLTIDLGTYGRHEVVLSTGTFEAGVLEDTQVLCRREAEAIALVAAHSHGKGIVLLRPDQQVEPGTLVS